MRLCCITQLACARWSTDEIVQKVQDYMEQWLLQEAALGAWHPQAQWRIGRRSKRRLRAAHPFLVETNVKRKI